MPSNPPITTRYTVTLAPHQTYRSVDGASIRSEESPNTMQSLPSDDDDEEQMTGVEADEVRSLQLKSVFVLTSVSAGLDCSFTANRRRSFSLSTRPNGRFCVRPPSRKLRRDRIPWIRRSNDHNCLGATSIFYGELFC